MDLHITTIGRVFFALCLIGLGVDHFIFGEFVTGRAPPRPESISGAPAWAYATGTLFIAIGVATLFDWNGRIALIVAAALIFVWALLRNVPVVADAAVLSNAWTRTGKSVVLTAGCLTVAAALRRVHNEHGSRFAGLLNGDRAFLLGGRIALGLFLVMTGIQHFMFTTFVASLIPGWFPGNAVFWTYFAGVALISGGLGLFVPMTARIAALLSGLMVFSWFWIVHIPRTLASVSDAIAVFEALGVAGILFVIAGRLSPAASTDMVGVASARTRRVR